MTNNELEFQNIYNTFQPKIHFYLARLVGEHEADDLTQEVFLKVNKGLQRFRGEAKLSTWIYRIATNVARDKLRSPTFRNMVQNRLTDDSIPEDKMLTEARVVWMKERAPSVEQQLIRKEMNECIRSFVDKLPDKYKTALVLSELEGFNNQEIAQILDVSLDTVKIRLHRAREKLKKELETHCDFYRDERNELACDLKGAFLEFRKSD
jgi:RNA polymerase sigma-70 factor (ECF subfamily)